MTKTQKLETELNLWKNAANAMFRFIQKNPPKDFNLYGFVLLAMGGRIDELPDMLDGFNAPKTPENNNEQEG